MLVFVESDPLGQFGETLGFWTVRFGFLPKILFDLPQRFLIFLFSMKRCAVFDELHVPAHIRLSVKLNIFERGGCQQGLGKFAPPPWRRKIGRVIVMVVGDWGRAFHGHWHLSRGKAVTANCVTCWAGPSHRGWTTHRW